MDDLAGGQILPPCHERGEATHAVARQLGRTAVCVEQRHRRATIASGVDDQPVASDAGMPRAYAARELGVANLTAAGCALFDE